MNDDASPVGASAKKLGGRESDSEKENEMRNMNAREHQPSGADVEATSKRVESREMRATNSRTVRKLAC